MSSWGYVLERSGVLHHELIAKLSRVSDNASSRFDEDSDEYASSHTHEIHITGRIVLNIWRLMRAEVTIIIYL